MALFLKISFSIISDTKMASGRAPAGERRLKIRPLLPEEEAPRGRGRDWTQLRTVGIQKGSK